MVDSDEVLRIVRKEGPVLPVQIKRKLDDGDTITIGATLSELARNDKVEISHTKIGGSPVYYVPEQREKLQKLKDQLNDKQQKAFDMLKEEKVLRDDEQEPVIRASLRDIKDFAKPLDVNAKGDNVIYWKWYLTSNEEAEKLIREDLKGRKPKKKKREEQKKLSEEKEEPAEEDEAGDEEKEKEDTEESEGYDRTPTDDEFLKNVRRFFDNNDIEIVEENSIRKGSHIEFVVKVPTPVGKQKYYCKARGKKKCNDGDLSSAHVEGQSRNLPVLFLYTGKLTKKAKEMAEEEFQGMMLEKV